MINIQNIKSKKKIIALSLNSLSQLNKTNGAYYFTTVTEQNSFGS